MTPGRAPGPAENRQDGNVGNLGDILKHAALLAVARLMRARHAGRLLNYLDTHAYRLEAPLSNREWSREVDRIAARYPAYEAYRARERPWVADARYLCSVGLVRGCVPGVRMHLSERDAATRRLLRVALDQPGDSLATVLADVSAWSAPGRVWPRRPLLALVDPFRLSAAVWAGAVAAIARLHAAGEGGVVLVFDYAEAGAVEWPTAPAGWQGPLATVERVPYRLAAYGTGSVSSHVVEALLSLGWSRRAGSAGTGNR